MGQYSPTHSLCGCTVESLPPPSSPLSPPSCSSSHSSCPSRPLCGCTAESPPPSAPHAPHRSILPTRSLCGCTAETLHHYTWFHSRACTTCPSSALIFCTDTAAANSVSECAIVTLALK